MTRPAEQLEGATLSGGWIVDKILKPRPGATGGTFSTGYTVSHPDGRTGFLKAMDYSSAFESTNFVDQMKILADAYTFERDVCIKCDQARVTRVVHAIDHGYHMCALGQFPRVEYLIFERADGDVRAFLDATEAFDLAFALRSLHAAAAAIQQLHQADIAHQDIKPSNVLVFSSNGMCKLGDLGRAWAKGMPSPHDDFAMAGDPSYAPIELLYGVFIDEHSKRFGCDLYLLGSLVVFMFARVNINALILKHLDPQFHARGVMTYTEALPYLQLAFADALEEFASHVPASIRDKIRQVVVELCEPDPRRRGNPIKTSQPRYSLARYISAFDLLARRAELSLIKAA